MKPGKRARFTATNRADKSSPQQQNTTACAPPLDHFCCCCSRVRLRPRVGAAARPSARMFGRLAPSSPAAIRSFYSTCRLPTLKCLSTSALASHQETRRLVGHPRRRPRLRPSLRPRPRRPRADDAPCTTPRRRRRPPASSVTRHRSARCASMLEASPAGQRAAAPKQQIG